MRLALRSDGLISLAVPAGLLCGLLGIVSVQLGVIAIPYWGSSGPETLTIPAQSLSYRAEGDFQQNGIPVNGPMMVIEAPALDIMRYQVTLTQYGECVAAGACKPANPNKVTGEAPVTGVSYEDAIAYAAWLSAQTGATWRLPTIAEWNLAAGTSAPRDAPQVETDAANPALRWLATYEQEVGARTDIDPLPQQPGSYGFNEFGLADIAANVWEWTSTCARRTTLDGNGAPAQVVESCGIRYLEGRHRAAMNVFVRDARGGGCSMGVPPANLGFRLVREAPWYAGLTAALTP